MKKYYIYEGGYWSKNDRQGFWSDFEDNYSKYFRVEYSKFIGSLMILFMKICNNDLKPKLVIVNEEWEE